RLPSSCASLALSQVSGDCHSDITVAGPPNTITPADFNCSVTPSSVSLTYNNSSPSTKQFPFEDFFCIRVNVIPSGGPSACLLEYRTTPRPGSFTDAGAKTWGTNGYERLASSQ